MTHPLTGPRPHKRRRSHPPSPSQATRDKVGSPEGAGVKVNAPAPKRSVPDALVVQVLSAKSVGRVEGRATTMLEHDSPIEVRVSRRACPVVRTQCATDRYPVSTCTTLLGEPRISVARILLASVATFGPARNTLLCVPRFRLSAVPTRGSAGRKGPFGRTLCGMAESSIASRLPSGRRWLRCRTAPTRTPTAP